MTKPLSPIEERRLRDMLDEPEPPNYTTGAEATGGFLRGLLRQTLASLDADRARLEGLIEFIIAAGLKQHIHLCSTCQKEFPSSEDALAHVNAEHRGFDAERLADALWSALSDRDVIRIHADGPKDLWKIARSVAAEYERLGV